MMLHLDQNSIALFGCGNNTKKIPAVYKAGNGDCAIGRQRSRFNL